MGHMLRASQNLQVQSVEEQASQGWPDKGCKACFEDFSPDVCLRGMTNNQQFGRDGRRLMDLDTG